MREIMWMLAIGCLIGCAKEEANEPVKEARHEAPAPKTEPEKAETPDVDPFVAFAAKHELEVLDLEEPETVRSGSKQKPFDALYPRGNVRVEDLDEFRVDVTEDFEPGGKLEFRVGKTVLYSTEFEPEGFVNRAPIPDAVRNGLEKGKTVTWGYYPDSGRPSTAKFKVVTASKSMAKKIDKVTAEVSANQQWYASQVKAQLYLKAKLHYAAWREAKGITGVRAAAPHAYAVMQRALRGMKLHKSPLWEECQTAAKHVVAVRGRHTGRRAPNVPGRRMSR